IFLLRRQARMFDGPKRVAVEDDAESEGLAIRGRLITLKPESFSFVDEARADARGPRRSLDRLTVEQDGRARVEAGEKVVERAAVERTGVVPARLKHGVHREVRLGGRETRPGDSTRMASGDEARERVTDAGFLAVRDDEAIEEQRALGPAFKTIRDVGR